MVGKSYSRSYDYAGEVDGGQVPEWLEEVQRWWRLATRAFSFFSIYPHFEILATPLLRPFSSQQDFHSCVIYRGLISHLNFWLFVACCCGMWRPQHFTRGSILKDGLHFLWRHYWQWGVVACPYQRRCLVCIVCIVWYWMGGLSLKTRLPADVTVTTALLWGVVACPYQQRRRGANRKRRHLLDILWIIVLPHPCFPSQKDQWLCLWGLSKCAFAREGTWSTANCIWKQQESRQLRTLTTWPVTITANNPFTFIES